MSLTVICHCEDCPRKGKAMKVLDETERHWVFRCEICENLRTVDKVRAGGTMGAGRREDVPPKKYLGVGF